MINKLLEKDSPVRFILIFLSLFLFFYYFNIVFFGLTSHGSYYNDFLATHLNYIKALRHLLLNTTAKILNWMGYATITNDTDLLVAGHGTITLIYSCLGLGVISFFSAFVLAYPKRIKPKLIFLITGIIAIELLNIIRFFVLAIFWNKREDEQIIDHHVVFNIIIYILIAVSLYFWVKHDDKTTTGNAAN